MSWIKSPSTSFNDWYNSKILFNHRKRGPLFLYGAILKNNFYQLCVLHIQNPSFLYLMHAMTISFIELRHKNLHINFFTANQFNLFINISGNNPFSFFKKSCFWLVCLCFPCDILTLISTFSYNAESFCILHSQFEIAKFIIPALDVENSPNLLHFKQIISW